MELDFSKLLELEYKPLEAPRTDFCINNDVEPKQVINRCIEAFTGFTDASIDIDNPFNV